MKLCMYVCSIIAIHVFVNRHKFHNVSIITCFCTHYDYYVFLIVVDFKGKITHGGLILNGR